MEFIKGNWVGDGTGSYLKFDRLEKCRGYNKVCGTEYINSDGKYYNHSYYWANTQMELYALKTPVNIEELRKFLPEGHPDLNNEPQYEIY